MHLHTADDECMLGTKDQLHTLARKGDDSMNFNSKDAVDLMIPIIQGLEDPNTIPTPTVQQWRHRHTCCDLKY